MKPFDYSTVRQYKLYGIMKPILKFLSHIFYKINYVGKENFPKKGGYIIASNHISAPDPAFIYLTTPGKIHFLNKAENFEKPFFNWMYTHFNAIPITRGASDRAALEYAIKVIEQGDILGIFPEGTRSKDYTPQQAKAGVALIARETKADVVPISIYSEDKAKFFTKITVRIGEPIPYESLGFHGSGKSDELRNASKLIMEEIKTLWGKGHCQ